MKYQESVELSYTKQVAPFTGAWIEIAKLPLELKNVIVAPFTGAWIEIQ